MKRRKKIEMITVTAHAGLPDGEAQQVRQYLGQRAQTKGEFVKGDMN